MIGRDRFLALFPEFSELETATIDQWLAAAEARIDPSVFGSTEDQAHGLLAASLLAASPSGQAARLTGDGTASTYAIQFDELARTRAALIRVF